MTTEHQLFLTFIWEPMKLHELKLRHPFSEPIRLYQIRTHVVKEVDFLFNRVHALELIYKARVWLDQK